MRYSRKFENAIALAFPAFRYENNVRLRKKKSWIKKSGIILCCSVNAVEVSSPNLIQSSKEENIPEISIESFSSIYLHDNKVNIYLFGWENVPGNTSGSV